MTIRRQAGGLWWLSANALPFAAAADLPNVSGSPNTDTRLLAGDSAFVTALGIYVCTTPTPGAAAWVLTGPGGATLDGAYNSPNADNDISITAAKGSVILRSTNADVTNLIELRRSHNGAGDALLVDMSGSADGVGVHIVGGGAGIGLHVVGSGGEYTGPLVKIEGGTCGVGAIGLRIESSSGNMIIAQDIQVSSNAIGLRIGTNGGGDPLLVTVNEVAVFTVQADRDILLAGGDISVTGGAANPGKNVVITGGAALSGDNNGGYVSIDAGAKSGSGLNGSVLIGGANAKSILMGNSTTYPLLDHTGQIVVRPQGFTDTIDYVTALTIAPSTLVATTPSVIVCEGNPNGNIDGPTKGSVAIDATSSPPKLYIKNADSPSTVWNEVGSSAAGALQATPISAARALPNNVSETWWTCNGHVIIYGLVMEVVTAIQASTANAKFIIDPPAAGEINMNAVIDMNGWGIGRSWTPIGDGTTTEESSGVGSPRLFVTPEVGLDTSTIKVHNGSSVTGTVTGYIVWSPMESGSTVTANV